MSESAGVEGTRRLVVGDDGSPAADIAWLWVISHRWPGWRVEVVTAVPPYVGTGVPEGGDVLHPWSPPDPRAAPAECGLAGLVHLTANLDPRLALSGPADLVVVGPRGEGLLKTLHLGSTAEWLLQEPRSPVAVIRHGRAVRRALVCVDGSAHAERAASALAGLPLIHGAHVDVLTVDDGRIDADRAADPIMARLEAAGALVERRRRAGAVTQAIVAEIEARAADLVVLGTRGLTPWARLRLGSTAAAVVRGTGCSVLAATAGDL